MFTTKRTLPALATALLLGVATACGNAEGGEPDASDSQTADTPSPTRYESPAGETSAAGYAVVPAGTEIQLELQSELSTEDNQTGDRFDATVVAPVVRNGETAIPAGATVQGRVTAVQKPGDGKPAVLKVAFDRLETYGTSYPIQATLTRADIEKKSDSSTGEDVAKVGVSTAAGAVIGRVIGGNSTGTLIGAAVGAAAGTAIVLSNKDEVAAIEEGSMLTIRLDQSVRIDLAR